MIGLEELQNQVGLYREVREIMGHAGRLICRSSERYLLDSFENEELISDLQGLSGLRIDNLESLREYDSCLIVDPRSIYVYSVAAVTNYLRQRLFGFKSC